MIDPVMVIGTGRCGSSFVSGILHNDLNVCMGLRFEEPTKFNPEGYYEDIDIKRNNGNLLEAFFTLQGWAKNIKDIMKDRMVRNIPWGFKDPRLCDLLGFYLTMFENPKIIWCIRDRELVLKSLVQKYNFSPEQAILQHDVRMQSTERLMRGRDHLQVEFTEERYGKDDVIHLIKGKWGALDGGA